MDKPVSITAILCNYNGEAYLKEAIDSVLEQEYQANEFIIVDDKSTDNSLDIIRKAYQDRPDVVTVLEHTENRGQAAGINTAVQSSTGDLLAFLDSDDAWFPNKLAILRDEYLSNPDFGLFQHNLQIIADSHVTDQVFMPAMLQGDVFELWERYGTFPFFSPTSGLAIRRDIFNKLAPLPEELTISADSYLTRTAICFGDLVSHLDALGYYRRHSTNHVYGNDSHNSRKYFLNVVSPLLAKFYKSKGFPLRAQIWSRRTILDKLMDTSVRAILQDLKLIKHDNH